MSVGNRDNKEDAEQEHAESSINSRESWHHKRIYLIEHHSIPVRSRPRVGQAEAIIEANQDVMVRVIRGDPGLYR